ncbi:MAG: Clp protease N-terminal domain-containing protein [Nanoarchaeota archaeon]|nr:Clp protease N-terminal domain-containing protein [Nanoarchaeota archaeon]
MYERFTDRARKMMALANQEAQRLNHEYVGTEHVLLGLLKEGSGVGATVLKNLGLNIRDLRGEVEKLMPSRDESIAIGRLSQTPNVKLLVENAINYARELEHKYVGTEHFLCALASSKDGVAAKILENKGLDADKITSEIENILGITSVSYELRKLIRSSGYILERRCVKTNEGLQIGSFEREGKTNIPVVEYDIDSFNSKQIYAALKYRGALSKNDISYKESLPLSGLVKRARSTSKRLSSLADRLEKRV